MQESNIINHLKLQMEMFLDGRINRHEYGDIAEETITEYGYLIESTEFYCEFMKIVPDLCLIYIMEPGDEFEKDRLFKEGIQKAYIALKEL